MCTSLKATILLIVCSMLLCSTCHLMNYIANIEPNQKKQDVQLVHENKPSHQKNSTSSTYGYGALLRGSTKFTKLLKKSKRAVITIIHCPLFVQYYFGRELQNTS